MQNQQFVVAIVDDDPSVLKGLKRLLHTCGFKTEVFNSGEAFLDRDSESEPACVVLDIHLGGISGIETRRRLAAKGSTVPVIYMTALDTATIRSEATASGCAAFLQKPFSGSALIDSIRKATSSLYGNNQGRTADA
jgi:FixJ family two-component response regulator